MSGQHTALLSEEFRHVLLISGDDTARLGITQLVAKVLPGVDLRSVDPEQESIPSLDSVNLVILGLGEEWARIPPELATLSEQDRPTCISIDYAASIDRAVDVMRQGAAEYLDAGEVDERRLTDVLIRIISAEARTAASGGVSEGLPEAGQPHDVTEILSTIDQPEEDNEDQQQGALGHVTQVFNHIKDSFEPAKPKEPEVEPTVQLSGDAIREIREKALKSAKESAPEAAPETRQAAAKPEASLDIEELPDVEEEIQVGPHTEKSPHVGHYPQKGQVDVSQRGDNESPFSAAWIRQSDAPGGKVWPFSAEEIEQGHAFLGEYRILSFLGFGGMASVFKAQRTKDDHLFAIKLLDPSMADDKVKERFRLEYEVLQSIHHRHVVNMEEQVEDDELMYIVMEYLPGGDLKTRIRRSLNRHEAVRYTSQIAAALHAAHQVGVLHRDLKPANVLFRSDGTLALVDFGVAKDTKGEDRELTREGQMVGTPFYASPEQATGAKMDGRSDLYALGVILYEMLQGSRPFVGDTSLQVLMAHVKDPVPLLPENLDDLNDVLAQLLAKKPSDRFADGLQVVQALAESCPQDVPGNLLAD